MPTYVIWLIRGLPLGAANLLPGVSGATIAIMLGFYQDMISSIKGFRMRVLAPLALGAAASIWLGARGILFLLHGFPDLTHAVLLGLLAASVLVVLLQAEYKSHSVISIGTLAFFCGLLTVLLLTPTPGSETGVIKLATPTGLLLTGAASSAAMLLPGFSGATILVLSGYYEILLDAASRLQLPILIWFACGGIIGLFSLSYLIAFALRTCKTAALSFLGGMILGSALRLPVAWSPVTLLLALAAFLLALLPTYLRWSQG